MNVAFALLLALPAPSQEAPAGIAAWDTFQTLVGTANKLAVNVYQYFYDRIAQTNLLPSLAALIQERSAAAHLAASWATTT